MIEITLVRDEAHNPRCYEFSNQIVLAERRHSSDFKQLRTQIQQSNVGNADDACWENQHITTLNSRKLLISHDGHPRAF